MVILNQQVPSGVSSVEVIGRINELVLEHKRTKFIVDSRRAEHYRGCLLKLNAHEAARLVGRPRPLDEPIPAEQARDLAELLRDRSRQTVFITRGENGLIVADKGGVNEVPGIEVLEQTDPVGAGDATVSAIAAALAAKQDPLRAAKLANIAASVTVRKLKTTGTASPEEILRVGHEPDYVYLPELAEDPRQARYVEGGEIELVRALPEGVAIRHTIFDHDGTISTLRQGWEAIMEPMMVRAILGKKSRHRRRGRLPQGRRGRAAVHRQDHRHPDARADAGPGRDGQTHGIRAAGGGPGHSRLQGAVQPQPAGDGPNADGQAIP